MKNKPEVKIPVRRTYVKVCFVFLILGVSFQVLTWLYWTRVLEPRLRKEALSQADVLAHSQAVKLADALVMEDPAHRHQTLHEIIDEVLLFTGPQKKTPLFLGIGLEVDYEVVAATSGSLDLIEGVTDCRNCFTSDVALYSPSSDELLGIARFRVSDSLFQSLSKDVRKTLFTQSALGIILLFIVWGVIIVLIQKINHSRQQAEMANQAKSAFLANMSHELRTPLNAIIGFSEMMQRDPNFSSKHKDDLSIIYRSGEHLLELINDILELSKIEAVQDTLTETTFDLNQTLENVSKMIRHPLEKKNLQYLLERNDNIPRHIKTDERKLRQILLNLLGNAIKFTDEGGVTLRVKKEDDEGSAGKDESLVLRFEVEDTGPGIPPDERKTMFDAFSQSHRGRNYNEGIGLGLAITRQFVEHLGGEISVNSSVGYGTIVGFTIKAEPGMASYIESYPTTRKVIGLRPQDGSASHYSYRILVVDDNKNNRSLLRSLLEQVGFLVKSAKDGREAVEINDTWSPHLIWMDMRMPGMDGYEATQIIRKSGEDKEKKSPIIIALTASAFKEDRDAVLTAGCDDFLRRPYRESEIWDMMAKHLGVSYDYEKNEDVSISQSSDVKLADVDLVTSINQLPDALLARLKEATELSDTDIIGVIIEDIRQENVQLAIALSKLAKKFAYDDILVLVQKAEDMMVEKPTKNRK